MARSARSRPPPAASPACSTSRPAMLPAKVETWLTSPSTSRVTVLWAFATANAPPATRSRVVVRAPIRRTLLRRGAVAGDVSEGVSGEQGGVTGGVAAARVEPGAKVGRAWRSALRKVIWVPWSVVPGTGSGPAHPGGSDLRPEAGRRNLIRPWGRPAPSGPDPSPHGHQATRTLMKGIRSDT